MTQLQQLQRPVEAIREAPRTGGHWLAGRFLDLQRDLLGTLETIWREQGDIVRIPYFFWEGLLLAHPDYVRHILQDNHRNYSKQMPDYHRLRWILGNGLLTSEGDFWLRQRRLASPAFHRRQIAAFGEVMTRSALDVAATWETAIESGQPLDIVKEMMRITFKVVGETLFGFDTGHQAEVVDRAFTIANEYVSLETAHPLGPLVHMLPLPGTQRFKKALRELDEVVYAIIAERRRQPALQERDDLLSLLMQAEDEETGERMSDRQLRDEVMTLMLAGHETTSLNLTWTLHLLSQHPAERARHQAELERVLAGREPGVEDLPNLPYNEWVVQESLRLYPPAYALGRFAMADDVIDGYRVPAKTGIFVQISFVHRHPDFWEEPDRFDPERFAPERSRDRHRFAFIPFSTGPRMCIGNRFALIEAQLVLATLAQRYEFELVEGHPVELQPLVTLRPKYGMRMRIRDRLSVKRET